MKSTEAKIDRVLIGRIMPGEDVTEALTNLVKEKGIKSGLINIIGALNKFTVGYFDLETHEYNLKTYEENVELVSCMGNIAWKNGEPIIHLHFIVAREDYSLMGGHLGQPSIISVTGEVYIYETEEKIQRVNDPAFDLSLLDL
ncbi:MAG: DNA-binding protein [Promethearchaeota archaeon]|nr:MAG: DNA-binding protein [Candidatus Lokiarchaeota archaeon]